MRTTVARVAVLGAGLGVVAAGAAGLWAVTAPPADVVQGQVEATEVDVSAKIAGRVRALAVAEGQEVRAGDLLAEIDSPELDARLRQAEAARDAARAQSEKARNGAREEEVRQARAQRDRAREAAALARLTFERLERLARDGVVARQRRDEAETQWRTAEAAVEAAQAGLDMAERGARTEDKEAAEALVERARGAVSEVEAFRRETRVEAPSAGEVARRNVEPGELVSPGLPLLTLVDRRDLWVTFQLREDRLAGLGVGEVLRARFPALGLEELELEVFSIAAEGDYATWRATSASGGFDLKTFEVKARPRKAAPGLRPGMTAVVAWDRPARQAAR